VRVANLQSRLVGGQRELGADVTFERPTSDRFPIWFRSPDAGEPTAAADPYVPALLVSAMVLHEDLRIDAPVSAPVLEAARERIAPLLLTWFSDFADVSIDSAEVVDAAAPAESAGVGCLFSGGVDCSFGSMLVACCLCLAPPLGRVIVPSSWSGECPGPAGSHPLIEPNWSLPAVRFELDGVEARRIEKVRAIAATEPAAFRRLRVCVRQDSEGLNCGHCFKCVRTQMELRVAGVSDLVAPFPHPPDLEQLKLARFGVEGHFWPDVLRQAEAIGDDELAQATRIMMGRRFYWPRFVDGWRMRMSRKGRKQLRMLRKYAREHPS
jgi:hypothetical protein